MKLKSSIYALFISGIISIALSTAPLYGWSKYSLEGSLISCSIEWKSREPLTFSYNMFIFVITFFLPLISLVVTNFKVVMIVSMI
jgi:hypothetical protein